MVTKLWENPDIFSIQVELPENPLRALNSYVITAPQGNLVIDTGFNRPECREDLWRGLEELGLDLTKTSLFLTHLHADHSGLVWDFVDRGCPVYMGRIDLDYLENRRNMTFMEGLFRQEGFPQAVLDRQARENQARRYSAAPGFPAQPVEEKLVAFLRDLQPDHTLHGMKVGILQIHCSRIQLQRVVRKLCEQGVLEKLGKGQYQLV